MPNALQQSGSSWQVAFCQMLPPLQAGHRREGKRSVPFCTHKLCAQLRAAQGRDRHCCVEGKTIFWPVTAAGAGQVYASGSLPCIAPPKWSVPVAAGPEHGPSCQHIVEKTAWVLKFYLCLLKVTKALTALLVSYAGFCSFGQI